MSVSADLLEFLVCPKSKRPLSVAPDDLVARLNAAITGGKVENVGGKPVSKPIEGGLLTEDGSVVYPIVDSIPVLLIEEGIPV